MKTKLYESGGFRYRLQFTKSISYRAIIGTKISKIRHKKDDKKDLDVTDSEFTHEKEVFAP